MPNGFKALFPESYVVYADCLGFHHAVGPALNVADYAPAALLSKSTIGGFCCKSLFGVLNENS